MNAASAPPQHTLHRRLPIVSHLLTKPRACHDLLVGAPRPTNPATRLAESLGTIFKLQIESHKTVARPQAQLASLFEDKANTPTASPKENISEKWRDVHGRHDWEGLLDPLHPWLRRELVKYGELAQATYDAFDFDPASEYCGSCRFGCRRLFEKLGLTHVGYQVTNYTYAMSHVELPAWMERSKLGNTWSKDSNWMGYVAVSDDVESARIGRRDIVVAWRGTVAPLEWYEDFQQKMEPVGHEGGARVEHGFLSLYTSKSESTRYNKTSAADQVMQQVSRLVEFYKARGEDLSLTITGHSLGGALALLNAYEAATAFPELPINVISFGAPRVGNARFKQELHEMGVKTLRVVVKQDVVPRMPGIIFNETLDEIAGSAVDWVYTHVGAELKLDAGASPFLKRGIMHLQGHHMLETYLHLVDGFGGLAAPFRAKARRDVALVNKDCDMLVGELGIPGCWRHQVANKGLVMNGHGRWVRPRREPEDVPSPGSEYHSSWNVTQLERSMSL